MQKKKGVALFYDPHNLYQFIWYYCTYGKDVEWTAVCLPNAQKGEYVSKYCEKTGIFSRIISDQQGFLTMSLRERLAFFLKMVGYAIVGKQEKYCRQLVERNISCNDFEVAVVLTDVGIISGAYVGLGKTKDIVILEDGYGDYAYRGNDYLKKHLLNINEWQGFLLAKMGYSNPAHYYPLKTTKYCDKFCSKPEKMLYRDYRSMKKLFDFSNTDKVLFDEILGRIYHEILEIDFETSEVILFTDPLKDYVQDDTEYVEKVQEYVKKNYKNILLKKHPRDDTHYDFGENVNVIEIDSSIPAEAFLDKLGNKEILFIGMSSILLYLDAESQKITYLYFKGMQQQCEKEKSFLKYGSKKKMRSDMCKFGGEKATIVEV